MNDQRQDREGVRSAWQVARAVDPMFEFPQIDLDNRAVREEHLRRFYDHEDYQGIRRFLAKPATRE